VPNSIVEPYVGGCSQKTKGAYAMGMASRALNDAEEYLDSIEPIH
jgi:hypothetical protein